MLAIIPIICSGSAAAQTAAAPPPTHQRGSRSDPSPSPQTADTQNRPSPGLLGDLGGARPWLREQGIELTARYGSESAYNATGGARDLFRETGQLDISATADMEALAGMAGGTVQATVTWRRGHDLGADAGLGLLQQVQEVYGRGQTWRLTQFWYEQQASAFRLKVGRSSPGEDFEGFSCHFQNLSFCGSQPGNLVGDYWYNWPVSQWAGRLRYDRGDMFVQVGAYEVNPRNLNSRLFNWHFQGQRGVLVPAEIGWQGTSASRRVHSYRVGGWYSSANGDDVRIELNGLPQAITGAEPMRRSGRFGAWVAIQQQLTGRAENGKSFSGLSVFLNVTQADRATSLTDNQIAAGVFYKGLVPTRRGDVLGAGMARTNVNARAVRDLPGQGGARLDAEYAAEIYYSVHPTGWLELRPNVQRIENPGGRQSAKGVTVLGLKAALTL